MIGIQLKPVDTWFFRNETPFTVGNTPQENVKSLFPPYPGTVAGAIRAALASRMGWDGYGQWPAEFCKVLGDGPEDLGTLSLDGPFLLRDNQPLFRMPRHVLGRVDGESWKPEVFLRPGEEVACDLGNKILLPEIACKTDKLEMLKPGAAIWLNCEGIQQILKGQIPAQDSLVHDQCLWSFEPRTGLERDGSTRTAKEGQLYSSQHVRPANNVSVGIRIGGLPASWTPPLDGLITLGGESRLAECKKWEANLTLEVPLDQIRKTRQVALIALTPLDLSRDICFGRQALKTLGNAQVVSACQDRPQRAGGWDSMKRRPMPLRSVLSPGSVLFCKIPDPDGFMRFVSGQSGLIRIGLRQEWGFGLAAPGIWPTP